MSQIDIKVTSQTWQRLLKLKELSESFDDELNRFMDIIEKQGAQ